MITVHNLRRMGFKVRVYHCRRFEETIDCIDYLSKGGITRVEIYDFAAQKAWVGVANCSDKDNYCKRLGVRIALGRALKQMGLSRQ